MEKDLTEEEKSTIESFDIWLRAKDIFMHNNFTLCEKFDIEDINQGEIGNCYFLSTISAMAEYADRFKDIFISKDKSENGCYQIRLFLNGVPKIIVLDDYFPTKKNQVGWQLAHCEQTEIWVNLLEKAWAKINGSYASTIAGLPSEAFSVLTEAPCFSYINKKYSSNEFWKIILDADKQEYIICTNSKSDLPEMTGLVRGHAYTIVSAYEYKEIKLLKLRNPWGSFEWTGDFSDKSKKWTEELKKFVGYSNRDDGIFFMKIEDFLAYFPYTFICKYKSNYFYEYKKFDQENRDDFIACKLIIKENTHTVITLHQKQQRFFKKIKNYKPAYGSIILAKYDKTKNPNYEYFGSDCSNQEKIHFELDNLEPGEYHIFANIIWPYSNNPCRYTISVYSAKKIIIESINMMEIPHNYFLQILNNFIVKKKFEKELDSSSLQKGKEDPKTVGYEIDYSFRNNKTGFFIMKFTNYRSNEFLKINLEIKKNDKLYLCKLNIDGFVTLQENNIDENTVISKYEILVGKNSNQIISWKLLEHPGRAEFNVINCTNCFCSEIPHNFRSQKDLILKFIEENMDNTKEQQLEENLFLKEMEYFDSIMFVVFNKNKDYNYKVKLKFSDCKNIANEGDPQKIMFVNADNKNYCFLKKQNSILLAEYKLCYSLKRI